MEHGPTPRFTGASSRAAAREALAKPDDADALLSRPVQAIVKLLSGWVFVFQSALRVGHSRPGDAVYTTYENHIGYRNMSRNPEGCPPR